MVDGDKGPTMSEIARGASGDSKPKLEDGRTSFRIKFRRRRGEPLQEGLFHIRIPSLTTRKLRE
jgi:hypothetical protein